MRINWGVKIIIVYSVFVLFMLGMVYMCTRQHFDLVSSDYYAQELKYQQVIDGTKNTSELEEPIVIKQSSNSIDIALPASQKSIENGKAFFYRPSDASKDFTEAFTSNNFRVDKSKLIAGLYKVKITWTESGKDFFDEHSLYISALK
jgi:hypothetical protein